MVTLADLPAERTLAASAVVNGKLWLMGGCLAGSRPTPTVTIYDPVTDAWSAGPALPRAGPCHAAVHDGEVHVTSSAHTWRYNGTAWVRAGGGIARAGACESVILG